MDTLENAQKRAEYWKGEHAIANAEIERLHKALEKIADWQGAWGPYPETSAGWRSFAIVTAREAVPNG